MNTYTPCDDFRTTMAKFASGLTIISTPENKGFTCSAFLSVSLDPMLVAFTAMAHSSTFDYVRKHEIFGVSILGKHQKDIVYHFADRTIQDRFADVAHFTTSHGVPIVSDGLAWLVCEVERIIEVGDHNMVIGKVLEHGISPGNEPIIFYDSKTFGHSALQ